LDALPREVPGSGDLRDRPRLGLDGSEHAPARGGLSRRRGKRVACRGEQAFEAENLDDDLAQQRSLRRPDIDSLLSSCYHDSILS
jgi:hypothetical protein